MEVFCLYSKDKDSTFTVLSTNVFFARKVLIGNLESVLIHGVILEESGNMMLCAHDVMAFSLRFAMLAIW